MISGNTSTGSNEYTLETADGSYIYFAIPTAIAGTNAANVSVRFMGGEFTFNRPGQTSTVGAYTLLRTQNTQTVSYTHLTLPTIYSV